ncbi:MAG TPA: glycoside hydrolase family 43 protein [Croceibacterium sp.]|nr:glycoside hydrolase family 43 protein [Croceibacterium sp.]
MVAALLSASAPALAQAAPPARFEAVSYHGAEAAEPPAETFRNPVLPGFHPDPSIVRVGADFYLVNSTFAWLPGIPVLHSRDLVSWRLLGHAIDRAGQLDFTGLGTNRGIFAPAITHHAGRFYIVTTCIDCGGNFYVTASDPAGPWSDPVWLEFDGIDPSLFIDDDGRGWLVNNGPPAGPPRYEGHRAIWIQQFDLDQGKLVGPRTLLVDGGVDPAQNPIWAEGPHIYKVGEWYYLMAAEGGTADRHSETIYRSRTVEGPYVPGPVNPILTQRDLPADRPDRIEATGHADLVQLDDGSWWGVFLATRPFAGQSTLLGRETFLLPVRWVDGWPRFLDPGAAVPPVVPRPRLAESPGRAWTQWRDEFDSAKLSPEWIALRRDPSAIAQLEGGALVLAPGPDAAGGLGQPAFVGRRLRHHAATVETTVDFGPERAGDFAGLLAFMDESHFLAVGIENLAGKMMVVLRRRTGPEQPERGELLATTPLPGDGPVALRLTLDGGTAALAYRPVAGADWLSLAERIDVEPLASIHAGLFTGLVIGPYAVAGPKAP